MTEVTLRFKVFWTAQINDLVGGWIVTTYPRPLSEHDMRKNGNRKHRGVIACECSSEGYAKLIAGLLNDKILAIIDG